MIEKPGRNRSFIFDLQWKIEIVKTLGILPSRTARGRPIYGKERAVRRFLRVAKGFFCGSRKPSLRLPALFRDQQEPRRAEPVGLFAFIAEGGHYLETSAVKQLTNLTVAVDPL